MGTMAVELNHTIVISRDNEKSATFLAELMGLPAPVAWGPFYIVEMGNGVSLDFHTLWDPSGEIQPQHYAFLISEDEFDQIFGRIQERGMPYWADPMKHAEGKINTNDGGRGVYFEDPDGHFLEIITVPYGGGD
jgi:catechol 2,3-dioxygenase-like lactoylglutathione lyase family enzyme